MNRLSRRELLRGALAIGITPAWAYVGTESGSKKYRERRELFPEGVASGDSDSQSVILWTRRPFATSASATLRVEIAENATFDRIIAATTTRVSAVSDWTCRVLVG